MENNARFAFFGTPGIAHAFLDALLAAGGAPALIVSAPDKPAGRGLALTPPPVAAWARERGIPLLQPEKIDDAFIARLRAEGPWDVFIVVAYGMLLPQPLIELPRLGTLNAHFSILPRWRGASPVESAILAGDTETGVAIQIMRPKLDTGPAIAIEKTVIGADETAPALRARLGDIGARLLVETLPCYLAGGLRAVEQDDSAATYAKKIRKEDGDITRDDNATKWRKYRAYAAWPGTYFFAERGGRNIRVKIAGAHADGGRFIIDRIVPEGKREMNYADFMRR